MRAFLFWSNCQGIHISDKLQTLQQGYFTSIKASKTLGLYEPLRSLSQTLPTTGIEMPHIRVATLSDAKKLTELAELTFRDAFAEQNSPENIDQYCESSFSEARQAVEISSTEITTLVVEHYDALIGYAQLRWGEHPKCIASDSNGEIQRLYVEKAWHGKGVAHNLMTECLRAIKAQNKKVAWLSVWQENPRAISFYSKFNFQTTGKQDFLLGSDRQTDLILMRELNDL